MQIGQGAQWTGRAHLVVVLPWGLPWFLVQQEIELYGLEYHRSRVYSVECGSP
jgi:hypothetical protein